MGSPLRPALANIIMEFEQEIVKPLIKVISHDERAF
jgi:hypothetical protein